VLLSGAGSFLKVGGQNFSLLPSPPIPRSSLYFCSPQPPPQFAHFAHFILSLSHPSIFYPLLFFLHSRHEAAPLNSASGSVERVVSSPAGSGAKPQPQMHFSTLSGRKIHPMTTALACCCQCKCVFFILEQQKVVINMLAH